MIELGSVVRDTISGFEGTATGRAEYMHGLPMVLVEANTGPLGDEKQRWVRETRLEAVPPKSSGFGS